jgi:hypothetical protein
MRSRRRVLAPPCVAANKYRDNRQNQRIWSQTVLFTHILQLFHIADDKQSGNN